MKLNEILNTGVPQLDDPIASQGTGSSSAGKFDFLGDPTLLKFMAQLGANIDPKGAGGSIGMAATKMAEELAGRKAGAKLGQNAKTMLPMLLQALLGDTPLSGINFDEAGQVKGLKADTNWVPKERPQPTQGPLLEDATFDTYRSKLGL